MLILYGQLQKATYIKNSSVKCKKSNIFNKIVTIFILLTIELTMICVNPSIVDSVFAQNVYNVTLNTNEGR